MLGYRGLSTMLLVTIESFCGSGATLMLAMTFPRIRCVSVGSLCFLLSSEMPMTSDLFCFDLSQARVAVGHRELRRFFDADR